MSQSALSCIYAASKAHTVVATAAAFRNVNGDGHDDIFSERGQTASFAPQKYALLQLGREQFVQAGLKFCSYQTCEFPGSTQCNTYPGDPASAWTPPCRQPQMLLLLLFLMESCPLDSGFLGLCEPLVAPS